MDELNDWLDPPSVPIDSFSGDYFFLSNFYPVEIEYEGLTYQSSEHAYQAAKSLDPEVRKLFTDPKMLAGQAKKLGRKIEARPDWNIVRADVMQDIISIKFDNDELREKLLATAFRELIEGNWWGDRYWGVCDGEGLNMLGRLLMKERDRLLAESFFTFKDDKDA